MMVYNILRVIVRRRRTDKRRRRSRGSASIINAFLISLQPYKTVMYRNNKRTTTSSERCIIRSWKGEQPENKNEFINAERK